MSSVSRFQRIDLYSLRLFAMLVKDGSITRAAERHHIAASALSRRIAELENAVGAPLLVRSRKGVLLTKAGQVVAQHAEQIQDVVLSMLDAVVTQDSSAPVRLCASHSVIAGALPELMRAFETGAEHVRLEVWEANSQEVLAACVEGKADIGLGLGIQGPLPTSVEAWTLWTDRLQVVMREDHLLTRCQRVRFKQVVAFPLVGSAPGGALFGLLQQQAARIGEHLTIVATASNFSAACQFAEAGLGLAIVPATAIPASLNRSLTRRPLCEIWSQRSVNLYGARQDRAAGCTALLWHFRNHARLHSTSGHEREGFVPAPGFESHLAKVTLLPVACKTSG
jgi:DNA-binding transcriptional LysR family regulator